MKNIFFVITVLLGFFFISTGCSRNKKEPSFKGKALQKWVIQCASADATNPAHHEAEVAIQNIGTNAIPYLLKWITQAKPAPLGQELSSDPESLLAMAVPAAFTALGTNGELAIPALTKMLDEGDELTSAYAGQSLGRLKSPALPSLIAALNNPRADVRKNAADFMIFMGTNALPAIPALEEQRNDPDSDVRKSVAFILFVLERFRTNAPTK